VCSSDLATIETLVAAAQNRLFILRHLAIEHRAGDSKTKKLREAKNVERD